MHSSDGVKVAARKLVLRAAFAWCAPALLCVPVFAQVLKLPDAGAPQKLMITILDGMGL